MYVAIDDTDSRSSMCTTFLLTEIIERSGLDLIGIPSLVRLNPSIPYKTRGNGALSARLGRGRGRSRRIGRFGNHDVMAFEQGDEAMEPGELLDLADDAVHDLAVLDDDNTNPGIVVSSGKLDEEFYWRAVRDVLEIREAEDFLSRSGCQYRKIKSGRGIIGAAAALSWPAEKRTYELIAYRYPRGESIQQSRKFSLAQQADQISGTFNNVDRENNYPAIFPRDRTPVIFGIRGRDPEALLTEGFDMVESWGLKQDRLLMYQSNQATDDHIIYGAAALSEMRSYMIRCRIASMPTVKMGSHYFVAATWNGQEIKLAAFEPTKQFRKVVGSLRPGDEVTAYGTYQEGAMNLEKIEINSLSSVYARSPPVCKDCGRKMKSHGRRDFRCHYCGSKTEMPAYTQIPRDIRTGPYDVPVIARRHLSRPFRMSADGRQE